MSYSVGAARASKALLEIAIRDELAKVPALHPIHEADIDQAFNAFKALLDLTFDDPARDLQAGVSGSIWKTDAGFESISLSVNIQHVERKIAPPS